MRSMTAAIALLMITILAGSACAYTYAEWQYGNVIPPLDGRALALGGAGIASADGVRGMWLNPALLGKTERVEVIGSAYFVGAEEAREAPLHDSFDGIIAYNTYALNMNLYDHYIGAVSYKTPVEASWAPTVAIGYAPRLDMNYGYHVQYRDPDFQTEPDDKILADYYADGKGSVGAFTVALGQEVTDDVYLGIGIDFLRGSWDAETRWVFPQGSDGEDEREAASFDGVSGTQFTIGALSQQLHRWDIGAVFRSSFTLKGDYALSSSGSDDVSQGRFEYKYPWSFGLGCQYHPRNLIRTTVSFDLEYTRWSGLKDNLAGDPDFENTTTYRLGVEHGFFDSSFARFGFSYKPAYFDQSTSRAAFSMGLGMDVFGARADISGEIGVREYSLGGTERLRETTSVAMASLYYAF